MDIFDLSRNINYQSTSNNSKDSNPFGDDDDDAENQNNLNEVKSSSIANEDSDDEKKDSPNYLNIKVKALYDYISAEDDELSFKAGNLNAELVK
jgi:hypothetical protein